MLNLPPFLPNTVNRIESDADKTFINAFGGYNHNDVISERDIYDMQNLSSDGYPTLTVRMGRTTVQTFSGTFHGMTDNEHLFYVDGTSAYYNGSVVTGLTLADSDKLFACIGQYICIWPDKVWFDITDRSFGSMEITYTGSAGGITIGNGTYADVEADANSVTTSGEAFNFAVGDAVKISGCTQIPYNNRTPIIREISDDGKTLRFYENTFRLPEGQTSYAESGALTIKREIPSLDYVCEYKNRLWGCISNNPTESGEANKGMILCTKLGRPFVWYDYDGLKDSSWAAAVSSDGPFTGAIRFGGYPLFFKEDAVHKVYGDYPSNFSVINSVASGVKSGCAKSLSIANETLFYVSTMGVCAYQSGIPYVISSALGNVGISEAVGGSDTSKYYLSVKRSDVWDLFVWDTAKAMWHREDNTHALGFSYSGSVLYMVADGKLQTIGTGGKSDIEWFAEFGSRTEKSPDKKVIRSLQIDLKTEPNKSCYLWYSADGEEWNVLREFRTEGRRRSFIIPIRRQRISFYGLKLSGIGGVQVFSITTAYLSGTEKRGDR